MRRASRKDENQNRIMSTLHEAHCRVFDTSGVGKGFPDLLVFRPSIDRLFLLEVKDGAKSASRRKLTQCQVAFHKEFPVHVVESEEDALQAVGIYPSS